MLRVKTSQSIRAKSAGKLRNRSESCLAFTQRNKDTERLQDGFGSFDMLAAQNGGYHVVGAVPPDQPLAEPSQHGKSAHLVCPDAEGNARHRRWQQQELQNLHWSDDLK